MKLLLILLLSVSVSFREAHSKDRPNVIVVFIDDMGYSDFSCFGGKVKTQHVDRLASEGIKFTNFYVNSPICSPSRVALTTGQYPHRWRITSYLNNRRDNKRRGMAQWLDPEAPTLARQLKKAGYATGHFGKWHMGGQRDVVEAPEISSYGFDKSLTNFEGIGPKLLPLTLKPNPDGGEPIQGRIWADAERLGKGFKWMQRFEITTGFINEALNFIDQSQKKEKPFFINLWPDDVHGPWWPPLEKWGGSRRALYHGVLDSMDEQLARLFDRVRNDPKLRDNTIITVCSDNGHEPGAGTSRPFRGAKTWMYEGGIRSPLIVWAPGLMPAEGKGTTNESSVFSAIDLNRSLYSLTGTKPSRKLDGEDLAQALIGKSYESRKAPLFWRRPPDRPGFGHGFDEDNPDLAVRHGDWKYLINIDGSDPQLYNLPQDPGESQNLAKENPKIVNELHKALLKWNSGMPVDGSDPTYSKTGALPKTHFVNPIGVSQDPWVVRDEKNKRYLWCSSEGDRAITIHTSQNLTSFGQRHLVWSSPDSGPYSRQVWAPELHLLDGKWHIYFAASDGKNENHRAYVLQSRTDDPLGEYQLHGPFQTGETANQNLWAIDMTPLKLKDKLYAIWSGWDGPDTDHQYLYIAEMESPLKLSTKRVRICDNLDYNWELTEPKPRGRGLNEGPQVLQNRDRTFVTYSCGASWLPSYKVGILELTGDDPLNPLGWKKNKGSVFQSTKETFGVGHSCFVRSPNGSEWWQVFHAKESRAPGWQRSIHIQPFKWSRDGRPLFGRPFPRNEPFPRPGGEHTSMLTLPYSSDLATDHSYFGHAQFYQPISQGLKLGTPPKKPVNTFRSGEKIILNKKTPDDFTASVTLDFHGLNEGRGSGILFRITAPSVGLDAARGYFLGIKPSQNTVLIGKMNGSSWQELKRKSIPIDTSKKHRLSVTGVGSEFTVSINGRALFTHRDPTYKTGTIGLRVTDIPTTFSELKITHP
ncbi:MAG: sulfatase-like hydrolase/transferase [Akkermansiaceae bacterium]|nr:sulfatase-like hydrolase/transferase [Akkermansiaceae bacterium]